MSTLSGVSSKGEKGKSKFQSLDINSLYNKTSRGETSEPHTQKSTVPRKHGMQSLGKVPSTRRPPANLPSLKSEHSGNDPTVSLVPTGGTGWGSKSGETGSTPTTQPLTQTTTASSINHSLGTSAPAVVGTPAPQTSTISQPPTQQGQVNVKQTGGGSSSTSGGDKTWSSVMSGAETGPSFLAHQSPQFQQEFPSLSGEGAVPVPPVKVPIGQEGQYGPGPSLRPQTEGSWIQGGGTRTPQPVTASSTSPPQLPFLPPESVPGGNRNNLGQFGSGTVPGGPPPPQPPQIPSQFKGVVPTFMLSRGGGFPNMFPANFNSTAMRPRFHAPPENRFMPGSRPPPLTDPEDLIPRPIIREEDLNRMDEISRDTGWATQDDIDYNQKLAFSDDEGAGADDDKDTAKDNSNTKSSSPSLSKDEKESENDKMPEANDKQTDRLTGSNEKQAPTWQGRGPTSLPTSDFRGQISRSSPHPVSITSREVDMVEDQHWKEKRRQLSEQISAVTEKAKQRKEEEEKRFEESRSKSHLELEQKLKKGKEEIHGMETHAATSNISEWEKESTPLQARENKDAVENFRQMTQLDSRPSFTRDKERERDREIRGEREGTYQRFQSNMPPRFQKQINERSVNQQFMRPAPSNNVSNNIQSFDSRWSANSHSSPHFSGKQGNSSGRRIDMEVPDREIDRDGVRENEEKEKRDRLTPESNIERERREREELEWEGRRGNSSWDHNRHYDDKYQGRREVKKTSNEVYSNKPHKSLFEERESEWRERPQRPDSRERPDRPPRPDSRDSRASRESRNSRESMRDDSRAIPELMNNDYHWADIEYEKEIREEKSRKKENFKDEKRETLPRREGYVPGPITREKMEAYEHKQNLAKAEKKEVIGGGNSSNISISGGDDDSWSKLQPSTTPSLVCTTSNTVSWADSAEEGVSLPSQPKDVEQSAPQAPRVNDESDKIVAKDIVNDKKKDSSVKEKDKNARGGGRGGGRGGSRTSGNYQTSSNYASVYYPRTGYSKEPRRGSSKSSSQKQGQWNASESEASADEVSASTESGKEDKKSEKKPIPRSPRPGERKKDKEERNRESKKGDSDKNRQERKQQSNVGQGSGYESSGGSRKEGFAPRGEPSRRGRGGFRTSRGNLGNVGGYYGPPGNKSPFPSHGQHDVKQEDDVQSQPAGSQPATSSDLDASAGDDKTKLKQQTHSQPPVTGVRQPKEGAGGRLGKNKSNNRKGGSGGEEWETTSEASDSESKNLKHSKVQQKVEKSKTQRPVGDKRGQFSTAHMNGRPSRSDDGKDNGFQEVRSKKVGKESRPIGKEETKRGRGKEGKGKGLQGTNTSTKSVQSKSYSREWCNNKPPRLQRLENNRKQQQQQQQQEVSEMNKINQSVTTLFPIRDVVTCSAGAPPPPPSVNAWDKPITATLRTTPPPTSNTLHLASAISNSQDKSGIDLNEHGQSGASSQTSSPSAEKALTKMSRDAVEKALLDGTTPPVQTIIFENTNYKVPSEMAMKAKYSSLKGQRIDKSRGKLEEDLDGSSHSIPLGGFKAGSDLKQGDNKPQETIQIPMSFSKNEDNADMKLDFAFDSDLSQLTEDKTNIPRSIHLGQTSAADLNQKIASVKKVWETPGAVMEHQHHVDENHGVVSTSSSFTPNFGSAVDTALDHSTAHQVDDTSFNNSDVYSTGPPIQGNSGGYSTGGANIIKQDPNSASNNVKPQPQQTTVMSSGIGTHSAPSLSSPPPAFTQQGHFNYQAQYSNMPAIPSPPAVLINSATSAQQVNHQGELYHSFPLGGPTVIGNQAAAARSGFSQYAYSLSQGLGQTSAAFSQQSLYHLPQPAAPPPPPNAPPDVFSSLSQYRIQPSAYGQSQQLSNNPSTVLITSSSNSLMSASVKSSPQPPIGAIGTKGGYQSSAHPQVPLGYIQYETQMLPQNFLQNSQLVQQRHGGSNVVPAIQPPTSYYSGSAGGQTGLFQPGSSILANTGSQPGLHSAATAFGMQGFSTQSAGNPAAPSSSNPVGVPSFTTQMGHFRAPAPATYLKAGNPSGQHPSDASKSPSNNQDVLNCVFSTGGGQIPSPKSRSASGGTTGGNSGTGGSAASSGNTTKQVGPSSTSQQPSPTQSHHKFSSYQTQQNLVLQQQGSGQNNRGGPQMAGGGVRSTGNASGTGNSSSGSLGSNGGIRYPAPIQRPVQQMMQQVAAAAAASVMQPRHRLSSSRQQHIKISNQYYPQQGNTVKLDGAGLEGKADSDKLQENNSSTTKQDKGKEEASSSNEQ